jgi:plastocyanin
MTVEMSDSFEFSPSEIRVTANETVKFIVRNTGSHTHEMVLGTMKELTEHREMMQSNPGMSHDEPGMARVAPGKSRVIVWQFTTPGELYFACLIDDHFDSGMMGKILVAGQAAPAGMQHPGMDRESMQDQGHEHRSSEMQGAYGPYAMARESSGTSWQPDSSPHGGIETMRGDWMTMVHGFANFIYDRQGGPRGDDKTFSASMLMLMTQRPVGEGTLGLRGMVSADPLMGKSGYPLLLQTGETANGQTPLIDRQHPHDLFMELAASYSRTLSEKSSAFLYIGLPGEPALGPPAFMHRFSGADNPEAPISHHWLDSTHIAYGVVTIGWVLDKLKVEASAFRGREPDESRYNIETGRLDSAALRLSYNATKDWALQVSRGHIKSPEQLEADVNVDRTTASVIYNRSTGSNDWQTTLAFGRNAKSTGTSTDAYLLESAVVLAKTHTFFTRIERADKDELFPEGTALAGQSFRVGKLSVGYVRDFPSSSRYRVGVGGLVSRYSIPSELQSSYGHPTSFMLFARVKID